MLLIIFYFTFNYADSPGDENISIILNGIESELKFITDSKGDKVSLNWSGGAWIYSVFLKKVA